MIHFDNHSGAAAVSGAMTVEDAEPLLRELLTNPQLALDLQACTHVHAATLQVLMALRPSLQHPPIDGPMHGLLSAAGLIPRNSTTDGPAEPENETSTP